MKDWLDQLFFSIIEEKLNNNKEYKELFENFKTFIHKTDDSTETNVEPCNDDEDYLLKKLFKTRSILLISN